MYQDVAHEYRMTTEAAKLLHFAHTEPVDIILVTTELFEAIKGARIGIMGDQITEPNPTKWDKTRVPVIFITPSVPGSVFWPTDEASLWKINIDKFRSE